MLELWLRIDDTWFLYGTYSNPQKLAFATYELGKLRSDIADITVSEVSR